MFRTFSQHNPNPNPKVFINWRLLAVTNMFLANFSKLKHVIKSFKIKHSTKLLMKSQTSKRSCNFSSKCSFRVCSHAFRRADFCHFSVEKLAEISDSKLNVTFWNLDKFWCQFYLSSWVITIVFAYTIFSTHSFNQMSNKGYPHLLIIANVMSNYKNSFVNKFDKIASEWIDSECVKKRPVIFNSGILLPPNLCRLRLQNKTNLLI